MHSLVIPVFRNEDTIDALVESLCELRRRMNEPLEVVFVVDGSPDRSFAMLKGRLQDSPLRAELVLLSRNFGSFAAIRHGLAVAQGPNFAVMAADLQEPIQLIEQFFDELQSQEFDVVVGQRTDRNDPWFTRVSSNLFWWFYRRLVQPEMPVGGVDVFGCNQTARDALLKLEESHTSLVGQLIWLGFRRKALPYVRAPRAAGRSAWTLQKKVRYMLDSVFAFTDLPIAMLSLVGVAGIALSMLLSIVVFLSWSAGWIAVSGYTPLMLGLLTSTSSILLGLGIVGAYVWRVFENSKRRPLTVSLLRESFADMDDEKKK
ncbi:MAG: glycosyltransferase family 2 protein [Planctomycetaceae bacterium]|nr:glycosyltransferase family 2 protein [Planctomycetaceae bacterium]